MKTEAYGAMIERGKILYAEGGRYTVQSLTRDGVTTTPMGALTQADYAAGDLVYFFMFDDGRGLVLGLIP